MSRLRPTTKEFLAASGDEAEAVEREFFARVRLPNKTFKTTCSRRLDDLNQLCDPFLDAFGPRLLRVMDIGASSGISTAEWAEHIAARGIRACVVGTDKLLEAELISLFPGVDLLVDDQRNILHADVWGRGCPPGSTRGKDIYAMPLRFLARIAVALLHKRSRKQRVPLVSRNVNGKIRMECDDVLSPNPREYIGAFDVVRAANILNRGYFDDHVLRKIIATLRERLKPGGLFVVCRTWVDTGKNHGTVFQLREDGFVALRRLNQGSEIEHLVGGINH
jgi:SAM-dependent methyltransferase